MMKKIFGLLKLTLFCACLQAQTINYLKYKMEVTNSNMPYAGKKGDSYEIECKSSADYLICEKRDIVGKEARVLHDFLFDFKKKVMVLPYENQNAYLIEVIDSVFKAPIIWEATTDKKTINGHSCTKYIIKNPNKMMGWDYTIWVNTNAQVNPNLSKYNFTFLVNQYWACGEVPGVIERLDFKLTYEKNKVHEGFFSLVKSANTEVKETEVKEPWMNDELKPGLPLVAYNYSQGVGSAPDRSTRTVGTIWTSEEPKIYLDRMVQLFQKIAGVEVNRNRFRPISGPYNY
jgi:hypothetical protein